MSITKSLFGRNRTIPETGERPWGVDVTDLLQDLTLAADGVSFLMDSTTATWRLALNSETVSSGGAISTTRGMVKVSAGAAITLSATEAVSTADAVAGQLFVALGTSDTNTITIPNGAKTKMNGDIVLGSGDAIGFIYDTTLFWVELFRSN